MESAIESASASPRASSLVSSRIRIVVAARCASLASILPSGPKTRVSRPGASAGETHATSPATVRVPATGPTDPNRHVVPPREGGYPRPDNDTTVPPAEDTAEGVARCVAVDEGHAATAAPSRDARAAVSSVDANSTPTTRDASSWIQTGAGGRSHAASADETTTADVTRESRSASSSPAKTHAGAGNPRRFRPKIQATSPPAPGPSRGYTSNTLGARHRSASATVATVPIPTPGGRGDSPSVTSEGANRPAREDPPPGSDWSAYRISTATRRGPVVHVIGATHTTARLSTVDARTHIVPMTHPGPLCDGASAATVAESSAAAGVSSAVETARANPSPATTTSAAPVDEDVSARADVARAGRRAVSTTPATPIARVRSSASAVMSSSDDESAASTYSGASVTVPSPGRRAGASHRTIADETTWSSARTVGCGSNAHEPAAWRSVPRMVSTAPPPASISLGRAASVDHAGTYSKLRAPRGTVTPREGSAPAVRVMPTAMNPPEGRGKGGATQSMRSPSGETARAGTTRGPN